LRYELIENLRVAFAQQDGETIIVDVYGGHDALCGTVEFVFADPDDRAAYFATLRRWKRDETRLTYVRRDDHVTLVDPKSLFARAAATV
jgi:hypothetical protein